MKALGLRNTNACVGTTILSMNLTEAIAKAAEGLKQMVDLAQVMRSDVNAAADAWQSEPESQFIKRTYVRTFCAYCEGTLFGLRQSILLFHDLGVRNLDAEEFLVLREAAFEVGSNGKLVRREKWIPMKGSLQFTVTMFTKAFGLPYELDTGGSGCQAYQRTLVVRDKLIHPKLPEEFLVSDQAAEDVCVASDWFESEQHKIFTPAFFPRMKELLGETGLFEEVRQSEPRH